METVLLRPRRSVFTKVAVAGVGGLMAWSMITGGLSAKAADEVTPVAEESTVTTQPSRPETTAPAPSGNSDEGTKPGKGPKKETGKKQTPSTNKPEVATQPKQAAAAEAPRKVIVRKYVEAPANERKAVPAVKPEVATPTPVVEATPVETPVETAVVEAPESPVFEHVAPVDPTPPSGGSDDSVTELALAENAAVTGANGGPDLRLMGMIAAALTTAVAMLGLSTLLFHRFGAVGSHSRAVTISADPLAQMRSFLGSISLRRRTSQDEEQLDSAHFAQMLGAEVAPVQTDDSSS